MTFTTRCNYKNKNVNICHLILCIIVVILFIAFFFFLTSDLPLGGTPVEATVTNVKYYDGSPEWYATYTVDDQIYTEKISGNTDDLYKGKKITIYHSDNPHSIRRNMDRTTATFLRIIFSSIFLSYMITYIINYINYKKIQKILNKNENFWQYRNSYEHTYSSPYENDKGHSNIVHNNIGKF